MTNPYEQLSDPELTKLVDGAVLLRQLAPNNRQLITCLVENGMPRRHAISQVEHTHPDVRAAAIHFYWDVRRADQGDLEAHARVEGCREAWSRIRAREKAAQRA